MDAAEACVKPSIPLAELFSKTRNAASARTAFLRWRFPSHRNNSFSTFVVFFFFKKEVLHTDTLPDGLASSPHQTTKRQSLSTSCGAGVSPSAPLAPGNSSNVEATARATVHAKEGSPPQSPRLLGTHSLRFVRPLASDFHRKHCKGRPSVQLPPLRFFFLQTKLKEKTQQVRVSGPPTGKPVIRNHLRTRGCGTVSAKSTTQLQQGRGEGPGRAASKDGATKRDGCWRESQVARA